MDTSDNSRERLFITTGGRLDRGEDMIKKEMIAMLLAGGQGSRLDRKSTRLNSSHTRPSRMPSSA